MFLKKKNVVYVIFNIDNSVGITVIDTYLFDA